MIECPLRKVRHKKARALQCTGWGMFALANIFDYKFSSRERSLRAGKSSDAAVIGAPTITLKPL